MWQRLSSSGFQHWWCQELKRGKSRFPVLSPFQSMNYADQFSVEYLDILLFCICFRFDAFCMLKMIQN